MAQNLQKEKDFTGIVIAFQTDILGVYREDGQLDTIMICNEIQTLKKLVFYWIESSI